MSKNFISILKIIGGSIGLILSCGLAGIGFNETGVTGFQKGILFGFYAFGFLGGFGSLALLVQGAIDFS